MTYTVPSMTSQLHAIRFAALAALVLLAGAALGEGAPKRFLVTTEMIVSAMQYRQLPVTGVEVRLSAPITATSANPMLDVQGMTLINPHNAQLRIACRNRTECLPFYVSASWPETTAKLSVPPVLSASANHASDFASAESGNSMRPGTSATLLIEDQKIHIRIKVICLESGVTGDKVRVMTPDHKLTYNAEIVTPTLLKGSF